MRLGAKRESLLLNTFDVVFICHWLLPLALFGNVAVLRLGEELLVDVRGVYEASVSIDKVGILQVVIDALINHE